MIRSDASRQTTPVLPKMIVIPTGAFLMGNDAGRDDERPAHRVRLPAFRAAVAPLTNAEYARFVEDTGAAPPPFLDDPRFNPPDQPVVGVSWFDALACCAWLADRTGIPFRLPTEAEREFAARGGIEQTDWPWDAPSWRGHPLADGLAALDRPHPPDERCTNGYGLLCMAENVHEWCSDWYAADYYAASPVDAPAGPPTGTRRASRGGAWRHMRKFTRVSARSSLDPSFHYNDFGFRVYADA